MAILESLEAESLPENISYVDVRASNEASVDMSDVNWLTSASFHRMGPDLAIESTAGEKIFLVGYFETAEPMDIVGMGGAAIPSKIVTILSGSETPGQYAQSVDLDAAEPVGRAETVEGSVYAVRVDGTRVDLNQGDPIYQGDTIETSEDGLVGITFADDSTLSLDQDGRMVIDEMVYDPGEQDGSASMFVLQGAMSFVSGSIAKANPDAMSIDTPIATIGIRGTSVLVSAKPPEPGQENPQVTLVMLPEAGGDGSTFVGEAVVTTNGGTQVIGGSFQGTSITSSTQAPPPPQVVSLVEVGRVFGSVVSANPNKGSVPTSLRQAVEKVLVQMDKEKAVADAKNKVEALEKEIADKKAAGEDTEELEGELEAAAGEADQAEGDLAEAEAEVLEAAGELGEEMGITGLDAKTNLTGENIPFGAGNGSPPEGDINVILNDAPGPEPIPQPGPVEPIKIIPIKKIEIIKKIITTDPDPDPINQNPTGLSLSNNNIDENDYGGVVGTLSATDPDGDGLSFNIQDDPSGLFEVEGTTLKFKSGSAADYETNTSHLVEVIVTDGEGGSLTKTFDIIINDVVENAAPTANTINKSDTEDTDQSFTLSEIITLAGNAGGLDAEGDTVTLQSFGGQSVTSGVAWGSALATANGSLAFDGTNFTYTPNADYYGAAESISYILSDGTTTSTGTANIDVTAVNDAPVVTAVSVTGNEDTAQTFTLASVLSNASDVDGDTVTLQTIDGQTVTSGVAWGAAHAVTNGTLNFDGTTFTYIPNINYNGAGAESLAIVVSDGTTTGSGTLTVNVTAFAGVPDIQVNTHTNDVQYQADVTALADGGWLVAWGSNLQDGSAYGTYAQRYNADGSPNGPEFQVNTQTSGYQYEPTALQLSNGDIIIAFGVSNGGSSGSFAQRYSSDMVPIGTEFKLNSTNINYPGQAELVDLGSGSFSTTYRLEGTSIVPNAYSDIFYREFDASNVGATEVVVNTNNQTQHQTEHAIAVSGNNVLVTWAETSGVISNGIYGRVYNTSTTTWGADYAISLGGAERYSRVVTLSDGKFVVTWQASSIDGNGNAVQGQLLNADGTLSGSAFTVNTTSIGNQQYSDVTALNAGGFVVVWEGPGDNPGDMADFGIWGQVFDATGTKVGNEFLINETFVGQQKNPDVTVLADGDFIVTWQEESGTDGNSTGVFMKRFNPDGSVDTTPPSPHIAPELDITGTTLGFTFHQNFASTPNYRDVKLADVDGDGDLDAILAQNDVNQTVVRLNDGTGTMGAENVIVAANGDIVAADFNGDGKADFASASGNVYISNGNGTFTTGFAFVGASNVAAADIDNDGDMDLVVVGGTDKIYKNDGAGNFTDTGQTLGSANQEVEFADFDGDGDLDMFIGGGGGTNEIWANDGAGNFTLSSTISMTAAYGNTGMQAYDIEVADFNGDGHVDVWTTNRSGGNILLTNDGAGNLTFTNAGTFGPAHAGTVGPNDREGSSSGDLDGDGDIDVITNRWDGVDEIWINDGAGNFTDINAGATHTTATQHGQNSDIGDLNGDGLNDIFMANVSNNSGVLINNSQDIDYCYLTDTPINPFANLAVTDVDSTNMSRAEVAITGFLSGDTLAVATSGGLTVDFDAATGLLNLTGDATIATYQAALQSITFTSTTNATGSRGLQLTIFDDYGTTSKTTMTVQFVNTDPIVIDLDGDGVELLGADEGVAFDTDADGDTENIGWVAADDGLLVSDVNGDGIINDMSEVLSPEFNLDEKNPGNLTSSLEVLSLYDDNKDGVIDASDGIYDDLQVWQDSNSDGKTDEGELISLADRGITSIQLDHDVVDETVDGNQVSKTGSVTFEDGRESDYAEVAFGLDNGAADTQESFDETALFNEVVAPLLDEDMTVGLGATLGNEDLVASQVEEISQDINEIALLKEIVGPMLDQHIMTTIPHNPSNLNVSTLVVNSVNDMVDEPVSSDLIVAQDSYTLNLNYEDEDLSRISE